MNVSTLRDGMPDKPARDAATATGMSIALWAQHMPDETAIISPTGNRTFKQLNERCNQLVRTLLAHGVGPGDSIALVLGNRPEFAEIIFAATRGGLRYTPVNRYLSAEEMAYIVKDCGATALFGDGSYPEQLVGLNDRCPALRARLAVGGALPGFDNYEDALSVHGVHDIENPQLGARMLYTSGTTGRPKGVVRKPNYSTRLEAINDAPRYEPGTGQMNLCTGPYYHGGPLTFSLQMPLSQGVGVVIMEKWDAEEALHLIEKHQITHTHMVPTMFHRLLRLPKAVRERANVSSMQYILHGAAPCPVASKQGMLNWFGPIVWEYFAATEGSGASCSPEQALAKPGSVGLPPSPDHVKILDDTGNTCGPNEIGNIFFKGEDELDFEYLGDPEKTAAARQGTHFTVGDIGYLDHDGFLYITDRSSSVIISGGVNIYPAEVEATLLEHPAVKDAAVIGIKNEEWGESVKAVVQMPAIPDDTAALERELIAFCREKIAHFKAPRSIDFTLDLPRDDNGKLYRRKLLEQYRTPE